MNTTKEPLDRKGARGLAGLDIYTLRAYVETEHGRRKLANEIINMVAEDLRHEGAAEAIRQYADTMAGGPRLTRAEEIRDMRDVADRIERGEYTDTAREARYEDAHGDGS